MNHDHTHSITHLLYDETGRFLFTAGADGTVQVKDVDFLWTAYSAQFSRRISCVAWFSTLPVGNLLCGFENGSIAFSTFTTDRNDKTTPMVRTMLSGHQAPVVSIDCANGMFISASETEMCFWLFSSSWKASLPIPLDTLANGVALHKVHLVCKPLHKDKSALCIFVNGIVLEFCLTTRRILWSIHVHLSKNQITYANERLIITAPSKPRISKICHRSATKIPPIFFVNIMLSYVYPTNREFVFLGISPAKDVLVWDIKSGEVLHSVDSQDIYASYAYVCATHVTTLRLSTISTDFELNRPLEIICWDMHRSAGEPDHYILFHAPTYTEVFATNPNAPKLPPFPLSPPTSSPVLPKGERKRMRSCSPTQDSAVQERHQKRGRMIGSSAAVSRAQVSSSTKARQSCRRT